MSKYFVLYNPAAQKNRGLENARKLEKQVTGECSYIDMTAPGFSFSEFVRTADPEVKIVITGGDGTLNYLINSLPDLTLPRGLYFFPGGSGNDFIRDLELPAECGPVLLNPYLERLPAVKANGRTLRFLNGVGVGLDGFCCEEKERLNRKGIERSYTRIALEALLHNYQVCDAEVTVDGETRQYKKVWMAPTMYGRYFGGGIMAAPGQKRGNETRELTSVITHDLGRVGALIIFLFFCKGKGNLFPRHIEYRRGHRVKVRITAPAAIQIDGETISGLLEYEAFSKLPEEK